MYIILAAGIIASCAAMVSAEAFGTDNLNLLQSKLMQQSGVSHKMQHGMANRISGNMGRAGKGKGGKGVEGATCNAANDFCSMVTEQIRGCQDFWRTNGGSCSKAFCSVADAMQTYQTESSVLKHTYTDAEALRGACKTFVLGRSWGVAGGAASHCPDANKFSDACALPSTAENVETLKMATFCDELEYMCDGWALWFIAAAENQVSDAPDEDRYSCAVFEQWTAYTFASGPGGCESGDSFGDLNVVNAANASTGTANDASSDLEWSEEYEERVLGDATTMKWEVISAEYGCKSCDDSRKLKPEAKLTIPSIGRQACFDECQHRRWCMAVDFDESEDECRLFNWACEAPMGQGESWRLYRSDEGVSSGGGGRLDCDNNLYDVEHGSGDKWECPSYLKEYDDKHYGCLLPEGPLARCVCTHEQECSGIETLYDEKFRKEHPIRKRLSKVGKGGLQTDGDGEKSYTCTKKSELLLQKEAMQGRAESHHAKAVRKFHALAEDKHSTVVDGQLDISLKRKGCIDDC